MSGGTACHCGRRAQWVVMAYKCHHSAFNGYRKVASDYSRVYCKACLATWRTKAQYVEELPDDETMKW